ncbi:MAG: glycosyltransferase family 2 protein [Bacteroidales bacterium]|nr:glycosyltransferase family 2 protein [Bacteroidales bacterium]
MKKIAVVILNWNGKKLLREFLPSVIAHTNLELADIVVADNGSTDDSLQILEAEFPTITRLPLLDNWGFAEGYNRALNQLDNEYVVLLNNDVRVTEHWLEPMVEYLDSHPSTVACQPKIRSHRHPEQFEHAGASGGFIDVLGYPFCRGRLLHQVETDTLQYEDITPIFWATGACLFIRLNEYKNVGGLDESFFAHMEEIDLCWRLKSRGKNLVCIPQSTVFHLGAATLSKESPQKTYLNFRNNLLMLYKNLPYGWLWGVLTARLLLDILALFTMALKGQFGNARGVARAIVDFYMQKSRYDTKRTENILKSTQSRFKELYRGSIIFDFYVLRKKKITF